MPSDVLRFATVVVIDDVRANLRLLESSLQAFGLREIKAFSDSAEGLAWLQANPTRKVTLVGHTDASGALESNVALSKKRAASVRAAAMASRRSSVGVMGGVVKARNPAWTSGSKNQNGPLGGPFLLPFSFGRRCPKGG